MTDKDTQLDSLIQAHKAEDNGICPPAELWDDIDKRLTPHDSARPNNPRQGLWSGLGFSALAAGLMAVAVMIGFMSGEHKPVASDPWYQLAAQMNQAQAQQMDAMLAGYELSGYSREGQQAPMIQQQLAQLRASKQQLMSSMKNGGNAQMIELLRWINEQELQLLQRAYQKQPRLQEI